MTSSPGLRGWSHLQACHGVLQTPTYNDDRRRRQTPATITSLAPLVPTLCVGGPVIISSNRKKCVKNNIWLLLPSALLSLALFSKLLPFGPCFTKENLWGYVKQIFSGQCQDNEEHLTTSKSTNDDCKLSTNKTITCWLVVADSTDLSSRILRNLGNRREIPFSESTWTDEHCVDTTFSALTGYLWSSLMAILTIF